MKKTTCIIALLFAAIVAYGQSNHYLTKEEAPHDTVFIGPPPAFGSLLFEQDFHMYQYGKTLRPTERGKQAVKDAIWDSVIPNDHDAAFQFMLEKAKEMGLKPIPIS